MMTLEEAIEHCKDVALSCTNKKCALDHFQLLKWLQEYSNMLEKQGEQNPTDKIEQKLAWSEEDESNFQSIDSILFYDKNLPEDTCMRLRNWLKSLRPNKDTYNPYKEVVESIAEMCKHYDKTTNLQDFYDNIKVKCKEAKEYDSLFPQNTWKPSDEQMERLKGIINSLPHQEVLYSLYQDLKKLKEELL